MTQENKELLLKDLSARLPYQVKCQMEDNFIINDSPFYDYILSEKHLELFRNHRGFYIKPYLRPMSSMTEKEQEEYLNIDNLSYSCPIDYAHIPASERIDWLNKNHFDYRGLIGRGLAIDCTNLNIY